MTDVAPDELRAAVERLLRQVTHWTPSRWGAASRVSGDSRPAAGVSAGSGPAAGSRPVAGSRADVVYALVQRLADLGADAEGLPRRTVPRLDNDLALPDQLAVVTDDLLRAAPTAAQLAAAGTAVADTRAALDA